MIVRLPERLTQASCLQSWLQAMNVGTEILQVAEKHTNYCQKEMCVLTPGQRGGSSDRLLAGAMASPLVREAWSEKLGLTPRQSVQLPSHIGCWC